MTKDEYIKMLYQRTEYLKSEIADFEHCNGGVEQARLWAIKEQVSRIFGLIDVCDKELFPDTIRCEKTEQEYIQSCNTEQLAEIVLHLAWDTNEIFKMILNDIERSKEIKIKIVKEWLKQPHREE